MAQYAAFISYSHRDGRWAAWLHRKLEAYALPRAVRRDLGDGDGSSEKHPLRPIFRDREELSAGARLSATIENALSRSDALIVVCSPAAAKSVWVNREIEFFIERFGRDRIFPVIVEGPKRPRKGVAPDPVFPPALFVDLDGDGTVDEPLAADLRPRADGRRGGLMKLVAGLLGLDYDQLARRDSVRRARQARAVAAASILGLMVTSGLGLYAEVQRREATTQRLAAERSLRTADRVADFLVDTFEIANPVTENPSTITARTILERGLSRVERELDGEPDVQVRLWEAMGEAHLNLALYKEAAEAIDKAYEKLDPDSVAALENRLQRANVNFRTGDYDRTLSATEELISIITQKTNIDPILQGKVYLLDGSVKMAVKDLPGTDDAFTKAAVFFARAAETSIREQAILANNRGYLAQTQGDFDVAEDFYLQAVTLLETLYPNGNSDVAQAYTNIALVQNKKGEFRSAQNSINRALEILEATLTSPHPKIAYAHIVRGLNFVSLGEFEKAKTAYKIALDIRQALYSGGSRDTGDVFMLLANVSLLQRQPLLAMDFLTSAEAEYQRVVDDPEDFCFADLAMYQGISLAMSGRTEEAKRLCTDGSQRLAAIMGKDHPYKTSMDQRCSDAVVSGGKTIQ